MLNCKVKKIANVYLNFFQFFLCQSVRNHVRQLNIGGCKFLGWLTLQGML